MYLIVVFTLIFYVIYLLRKYEVQFEEFYRKIQFARSIPGPSMIDVLQIKKEGILDWLKSTQLKYGRVFRIWHGTELVVSFSDPEDIKVLLGSNVLIHKAHRYDIMRPWLGNGLLLNGGQSWHERRKLLTPAFHFKILSTYKGPMEDCCNILINKLNEVADGRSFDIYPYITLYALDIICETAMGVKEHAQEFSDSEFVKATQMLCKILHHKGWTLWQQIPFLFNLSTIGKEQEKALNIVHGETKRVIELRKKLLNETKITDILGSETDEHGIKRRLAFLDILILTQKETGKLTDKDIQEEVDTFMFEGHDTTSSAISFGLYLLSKHPEVQKKAYDESTQYIGKESESMKYLEAVIKEILRLYPPVPQFSRNAIQPIQVGNILVPKNTGISLLIYMSQRDPKIFPDPEKFDPERFLGNNDLHPYAHVAFSAGPRNCIGQKFAMLELKCTLSKLVRAFEILPVDGFVPIPLPELVLKSGNGIQIKLKKRLN